MKKNEMVPIRKFVKKKIFALMSPKTREKSVGAILVCICNIGYWITSDHKGRSSFD